MDSHGALGRRCVNVEADIKEEGQVNGVEPAVERYRFYINVHSDNLGFTAGDADGIVNHLLGSGREIHSEVFQAVFVSAGIVDAPCIDTDSFLKTSGSR